MCTFVRFQRVQRESLILASALSASACFHASTDYIIIRISTEPLVSGDFALLSLREIVVEQYPIRAYAAEDPLLKHLGFNLMPSMLFFLLSSPSRLRLFHRYVVVSMALRDYQQLMWCGTGIFRCLPLRTDFSMRGALRCIKCPYI